MMQSGQYDGAPARQYLDEADTAMPRSMEGADGCVLEAPG
jgi:hypothetical protein